MNKIPKIIHYCWFGRGKKNKLVKKCIKSWKKLLPDYKIVEWNEDNFDINLNLYVKQAYEAKKYAFVSDYVRLYALYNNGGIYMDTDVELLKSLDKFLKYNAFIGFEDETFCGTGIIGCKKENPMIKKFLNLYKDIEFTKEDGNFDLTTNVSRISECLCSYGAELNNTEQDLKDIKIFPKTYFSPLNFNNISTDFSEDTYTIHHFAGSWLPTYTKKELKKRKDYERRKKFLCNYMSERNATIILDFKWILKNKIKRRYK